MIISPIERPETLKDSAYNEIKPLLISGEHDHHKIFSANQLAETLQVSRTPVREALLQLTNEGYLTPVGGRGFKIREFSKKEIQDFFETRKMIECYVVERLADQLTLKDFEHLEAIIEKMARFGEKEKAAEFLEADKEFHLYLIHRHNNAHLKGIMDNIRNLISTIGHKAVVKEHRFDEVVNEHSNLLNALREKNKNRATACMREHLDVTEQYLISSISSNNRKPMQRRSSPPLRMETLHFLRRNHAGELKCVSQASN
jgi:DNA-binding GntR family transcriptional regulator